MDGDLNPITNFIIKRCNVDIIRNYFYWELKLYIEENDFEQNTNAADDAEKIDYLGSILRHGERVTQFSLTISLPRVYCRI